MSAPRKLDEFDTGDYTPDELREIIEAAEEALKHRDPEPMTLGELRRATNTAGSLVVSDSVILLVGNPDEPTESPCPVIGFKHLEGTSRLYFLIGEP